MMPRRIDDVAVDRHQGAAVDCIRAPQVNALVKVLYDQGISLTDTGQTVRSPLWL